MKKYITIFTVLLTFGYSFAQENTAVSIKLNCAPMEYNPKILNAPSVESIHPDWQDAEVGESWSFISSRKIENEKGKFLYGDLYSPKGQLFTKGCFVLLEEWECSK
jgi:hypothetical protein